MINTHIIRYGKNHYGKSNNILDDLRILISKWSGIDQCYITDRDIMECVSDVWNAFAKKHQRIEFLKEVFYTSHHRFNINLESGFSNVYIAVSVMIGHTVSWEVKDLPEFEDKYDIHFMDELCKEIKEKFFDKVLP
jgi:hypothetical protein